MKQSWGNSRNSSIKSGLLILQILRFCNTFYPLYNRELGSGLGILRLMKEYENVIL